MRLCLAILLCLVPLLAAAEGFAQKDMRKVRIDPAEFVGGDYEYQQEQQRLLVACSTCDDLTVISAEVGRLTDGVESRFRAGEATLKQMEQFCQDSDPKCQLTRLDLGDAVGWVSQYRLGPNEGSTAILFQDGDLLTIRSLSESRNRTGSNMAAALRHIAPQIVGE